MTEPLVPPPSSSSAWATLDRIFRPRAIVVVGASQDPTKRGNQAIAALRQGGYAGGIFGVNPRGGTVHGIEIAKSIEELPGDIDTALICTPAATVPDALAACAARGIAGAVVVALGFREAGADGEQLERRMHAVVQQTGIRVIGPNTSGILNPHRAVNLIGVANVPAGRIALLGQSGNVTLQLLTEAMHRTRAGFSLVIGVGNETDLRFDEYLEYLADEPNTAAIAMYVEGFRRGQKFLETAARITAKKPVILLKGGRTVRGAAAARSHTGALVGSFPVFRAGLRQAGVVLVRRSDELLHVAQTLASQPARGGYRGVAVLTDGGGHGTLAMDALHSHGANLTQLAEGTCTELRRLLAQDEPGNPLDLAGASDADALVFARCADLLMHDEQVGILMIVGLFGGYHRRFAAELLAREVAAAHALVEAALRHRKALVVHSLYAETPSEPLDVLRQAGVPVVASLEVASRCAAASFERGRQLDRRRGTPPPVGSVQWQGFTTVRQQERRVLLETEARDLVHGYGVVVVPASFCTDAEQASAAAAKVGGPIAMKAVAGGVVHKTEAGGVRIGVPPEQAAATYESIAASVRRYCQQRGMQPDLRGMLIAPALPKPIVELLIGFKMDPHYGGVIVVGLGGTTVEVLKDVTLRLLPISREDARAMLAEIKGARLLRGHRGGPAVDREAVVDAIMALAACARSNPEIVELEVNPLFAYEHGAVAVDVRALL
ncbi:MAG TPA: acetate--CoA ligase family protein [Planctomycetota bacterium]|nr:acetate--CoA ligase family protein [Planctomycetota bacterium]